MMAFRVVLVAGLMSLPGLALAQTAQPAPPTGAQRDFAALKGLAGSWIGRFTVTPAMPGMDSQGQARVILRITSRGNALVHEMQGVGEGDDPLKYDHPVTMFYLNDDQLNLIHYCDAGNRPHMVAKPSADGRTVEFDFVDITGNTQRGHMQHARITVIDANHHSEEWTFLIPGNKLMKANMDLTREAGAGSGK